VEARGPNRCLGLGKSRLTLESIMITYTLEDVLAANYLDDSQRPEMLDFHR